MMNDAIAHTSTDGAVVMRPDQHHQDGIKDTLESIIVALILAFVFRAFIVEAFVIPTGSMAPTLFGAHGMILCEDCGTEFAYGLRDLDDPRQSHPVRAASTATCPNCGHLNTNLLYTDEALNAEKGDRILVLKWPLDIGGERFSPARWDVTVFKDPSDGVTNFIKRLVGLPNEVLMVQDGDVYTVPTSNLSPGAMRALEEIVREKHEFLKGSRRGRLTPVPREVLAELDQKMRIVRKTPAAQDPLWFNVYHHDYPPQHPNSNQPVWMAAAADKSGWDTSGRIIRFTDKRTPKDEIELLNANLRASSAYNIFEREGPPVSDHRVSFVMIPSSDTGKVAARLSKLGRSFWGAIHADGRVTIEEEQTPRNRSGNLLKIEGKVTPWRAGEAVQIAFENLDYRLALFVNGAEVITSSSEPGSPAFYAPDLFALRDLQLEQPAQAPRLLAEGGDFELRHLAVERDVHYFNDPRMGSMIGLPWAPREGWGSANTPILLREGEFFMLGDNTAASKDSRLWDHVGEHLVAREEAFQLGTVPRDQIIGKAFFVYWPAGHRIPWLPFFGKFGIIPDVGRMRWIR